VHVFALNVTFIIENPSALYLLDSLPVLINFFVTQVVKQEGESIL
jgi:hypothetical protein